MKEWIFTTDHKRVGILYLIGSLAAFAVAGIMALLIRAEQFNPGLGVASEPTQYNTWLYFHGAAMILGFLIPGLTGFAANYLIPLMIGAKDVAFPRLNALSLWLFWMGIVVALLTFVIPDAPDIMWTGYPPYSVKTTGNTAFYVFTVHLIGFSSILGAVNFLTTIIYMRAPGMGWMQMNVFVWSLFTGLIVQLIFVPVLAAAVTLLLFDKYLGTHFFDAAAGGDVLLYQNLFWFYSHPAVYVIFLPAMGLLFEIISTNTKNRPFNYNALVVGMCGIVLVTGEVWVHHLYTSGMPDWIRIGQMVTTLMISVPVGVMVMSLWGTLYKGAISFNTPMYYGVSCLFLLLLGGLTGIPLAMTALDLHLAETSFIHAHFHFIMGIFAAFVVFASVYFWFPKITGRMYNEALGKLSFWLNFIGVNVTFWPLFIIGVKYGMPRRYYDYARIPEAAPYHHVATFGAILVALGITLMLVNWIYGAIKGPKATENPWRSASLEWTHAATPPPHGNFPTPVTVSSDWTPYNYK